MAVFECPDCHGTVSNHSAFCPHCGRPNTPQPPQTLGNLPPITRPSDNGNAWRWLAVLAVFCGIYVVGASLARDRDVSASSTAPSATVSPAQAQETYEAVLIAMVKFKITQRLRDPESVRWGRVYFAGSTLCGSVNSKNGFGGYTGMKTFVGDSASFVFTDAIGDMQRDRKLTKEEAALAWERTATCGF